MSDAAPKHDLVHGTPLPAGAVDRGVALCLSGGGYRATLFHLGSILRLNQLGVLARLSTITSVSGGSILNGVLATRWSKLVPNGAGVFSNIDEVLARPVRQFCANDLRTRVLLGTRLNPANLGVLVRDGFSVSGNFLADAYEPLYAQRLGELPQPNPTTPRFVFCATNVRTGACWHFHGGPAARMGDFYAGYCDAGDVRVSEAVAASSSFPPGFSALRLRIPKDRLISRIDPWGDERVISAKRAGLPASALRQPFLTDGGVYDNLGVEPVWSTFNTLLVSDAGRPLASIPSSGQNLVSRLRRVSEISMEQVGAVRKRWLVEGLLNKKRQGAIWTLSTQIEDFPLPDARGYGTPLRGLINAIRTDLDAFSEGEIACLINHGYSLADAALRSRAPDLCRYPGAPFQWPHPEWAIGESPAIALAQSGTRRVFRDSLRYIRASLIG